MSEPNKARSLPLALVLLFCFLLLVCVALVASPPAKTAANTSPDYQNIDSNEKRIALLRSFGWEVEESPREIVEVTIPREFDSVYETYNELQAPLGLDLYPFRGRTVRRYTYVVKNHTSRSTVLANLLFSADTFLGGDVCSAVPDGFVESLKKGV